MNEKLVDIVSGIVAAVGSIDGVHRAALAADSVIPSLVVVFGAVELESGAVSFISNAPDVISTEIAEKLAARASDHPLIEYSLSGNGNSENVIAISDLMDADEFVASELYADCYAGTGIRDDRANQASIFALFSAEARFSAAKDQCRGSAAGRWDRYSQFVANACARVAVGVELRRDEFVGIHQIGDCDHIFGVSIP